MKIQRLFEKMLFRSFAFFVATFSPPNPKGVKKNNTAQYKHDFSDNPNPNISHDSWCPSIIAFIFIV
tara:strand:+ start:3963 stop:4163 length:201 start_codon:yes stop_codon:yes gene_type:complete